MKAHCDYRWALVNPNEEDLQNGTTHSCRLDFGHDDDHKCACGSRPGDEW